MRLSRSLTLALAALTLAPWVYFLLAWYVIPQASHVGAAAAIGPLHMTQTTGFRLQMAAVLLNLCALIVFYLLVLLRTDRVPRAQRLWWGLALVLGNLVTMPVFWYRYLWRGTAGAA